MDLGERIRTLRKRKYTQEELAELVKVHVNTVIRWERGDRTPDSERLRELAKALNTSTAYLLGETDDPTPRPISRMRQQEENSLPPRISQATLDLEEIIKDLVYEHPDLAIGFRDTRENWKTLPEEDKQSIADALLSVFRPDPSRPTRLREKGRKGQV